MMCLTPRYHASTMHDLPQATVQSKEKSFVDHFGHKKQTDLLSLFFAILLLFGNLSFLFHFWYHLPLLTCVNSDSIFFIFCSIRGGQHLHRWRCSTVVEWLHVWVWLSLFRLFPFKLTYFWLEHLRWLGRRQITVEPRLNEPLYNEVLGMTNNIHQPGLLKCM